MSKNIRLDNAGGHNTIASVIMEGLVQINIDDVMYNINSDNERSKNGKFLFEVLREKILGYYNLTSATHSVMMTSCGSEGLNFVIRSFGDLGKLLKKHVVLLVNSAEHETVREQAMNLEELGEVELIFLQRGQETEYVNNFAIARPDDIILWAQMHVNNELGSVFKYEHVEYLPKNVNILVDAVQSFGHEEVICDIKEPYLLRSYAKNLEKCILI